MVQAKVVKVACIICAAVFIALVGPVASLAQSDTHSTASSDAPSLTEDELTELAGWTPTAKKPDPTALSGVTVAVHRPPAVSELTVTVPTCPQARTADPDTTPPKLLSSYPAPGSTVRSGILILRLTFDKPMTCVGLLNSRPAYPNPCPAPLTNPLFSRDRRTFLTVCTVKVQTKALTGPADADFGNTYGLKLENFASLSGQPLEPRSLDFTVAAFLEPVRTVKEAMAQDRFLRDAQKAAEQAQVTTAAMAQASPPSAPEPAKAISAEASPPPSAKTPSERADTSATPVSPLTVQAPFSPRAVQDFVTSYGAVTAKLDHYPRWFGPACVAVDGVVAAQAAKFKARVEQVARMVGAPVGPAKCDANIEIAFTTQPQQYIDAVAARNPTVLGYGGDKTVTRPVQAWYATLSLGQAPPSGRELNSQGAVVDWINGRLIDGPGSVGTERTKDKLGMTPSAHNFAEGRRCIDSSAPTCPHSGFVNVLVLVDATKMGDVSLDLTADYLAMLALAQPQPRSLDGCMPLPSVIDLYATACPNRTQPTGLTSADMAYLKSLYAADLTVEKAKEEKDITGRMVKILTPAKGASR